jgi:hypothetical protein
MCMSSGIDAKRDPISLSSVVCEVMFLDRERDAGDRPIRLDVEVAKSEHDMRRVRIHRGSSRPEFVGACPATPPLAATLFRWHQT